MDIYKIRLNPDNPRTIKDDKFKKLVKSLQELPVMTEMREVILDENNIIIGGNMRFRAAKEAGWKEIPTKVFTREMAERNNELTKQNKTYEEYVREIIIKDNISGGEWNFDELANQYEKEELEDWGMDVDKWADDEVVEDEAPEVSTEEPISKLGEVYQLGRHRLMCGDSVNVESVNLLMEDNRADLVFTDPPWNVNYGAVKEGNKMGYRADRTIENDNMGEDFTPWMNAVFSTMNAFSKDGCMTYVVMSAQEWGGLMNTLKDNGYHWSSTIIWNKDHLVLSRKDYHTKYEPIWYGWKEGSRICPLKDRKQSDVWDINRPIKSEEHPTMKPIELCARAIQNSSSGGNIVLDLFGGSGSTLIACEQTNRECRMMELDPKYCDVIRKRYAKFIGKDEEWEKITSKIN